MSKTKYLVNKHMNVLLLTPDAVGSTLLQRLLTIYMQFHQFDRPVINLHELTNGLDRYWSPEFNREILGKKKWGYHQTLAEVTEILGSVDHYKIARLAEYHIRQRKDSLESQIPFYRYLDENFYVISCRRKNLFEFALSHSINTITKKLNVYEMQEKIKVFSHLYQDRIRLQPQMLISHLTKYKDYIKWSEDHFSIANHFEYDHDVFDIEKFILTLPIFAGQPQKITWNQTFGMEFEEWNRCHYLRSDVGALAMQKQPLAIENHEKTESITSTDTFSVSLPLAHKNYLSTNLLKYRKAHDCIKDMIKLGILVGPVPIKKQTLKEKMFMISNLDECIDIYNQWAERNPDLANTISLEDLGRQAESEYQYWDPVNHLVEAKTLVQLPSQQ